MAFNSIYTNIFYGENSYFVADSKKTKKILYIIAMQINISFIFHETQNNSDNKPYYKYRRNNYLCIGRI